MKKLKSRVLAKLLAVLMTVSLLVPSLPSPAFAVEAPSLSVSVSPGAIVESLSANVSITVASNADEDIFVYLSADGNQLGKTPVPSSGKVTMRIAAAPAAGIYSVVAETVSGSASASAPISVLAYEPDKLWAMTLLVDEDSGKLEARFHPGVTLKAGAAATVGGETVAVSRSAASIDSLILDIPASSIADGTEVKISGVKFPQMFPSYSFTFSGAVNGLYGTWSEKWVGAWASGQYYGDTAGTDSGVRTAGNVALTLPNSTLRQMVRPALSGRRIRITFSNEYGTAPMTINAVSVAKASGSANTSNIDTSTSTPVTFNGGSVGVVIAAGEFATSDPIDFPVSALERIAVSTYFGSLPTKVSAHIAARCNSYVQPSSNAILSATVTGATNTHWFAICNVDVLVPPKSRSVVVLGDSITDGYGVTNESYTRWVDILMNDLQGNAATKHLSVINMGIGTNLLMSGTNPLAARDRFARDVLDQPGVGYVILQIGVNDLPGTAQTPENMIAAFEKMFADASAKGIKVYCGTVSPRGSTAAQDANRQTLNEWIRRQYADGKIDGLVDFDALLRNPSAQNTLLPAYRNDSIHPNAAGYRAMGDYVYNLILGDLP